ncbi:MAG: pilus assembly FimT family protein [Desulfomonilaceae bacterium]
MKGFTLVEFIVAVAIVAVLSIFGMRYYFTYVESYRFQNAISEFKSAVNLARARSMSGIVASAGVMGDMPTAIPARRISYADATTLTLTTSAPHKLTASMLPVYLTLLGFSPADESQFTSSNLFPWYINGPQCKVKEVLGSDSLSVDVGLPVPSYVATDLKTTAYAFMNYSVNIRGVESIEGGHYAKAYESGPTMDFQYRKDALAVSFVTSDPGSTPKQGGAILFRRGATAGEKTYRVSFSLITSSGEESKTTVTVLPVGAVR